MKTEKKAQPQTKEEEFEDWLLAIGLTEAVRSHGEASKSSEDTIRVTR